MPDRASHDLPQKPVLMLPERPAPFTHAFAPPAPLPVAVLLGRPWRPRVPAWLVDLAMAAAAIAWVTVYVDCILFP